MIYNIDSHHKQFRIPNKNEQKLSETVDKEYYSHSYGA